MRVLALAPLAFREWSQDRAPRLAAALAYYGILALPPLLVIVISIAGLAFGEEAARGRITSEIRALTGQGGAEMIETMVAQARKPASSVPAMVLGILTLLLGATGIFVQLKDTLNTVWEVKSVPKRWWAGFLRERVLTFGMVLVVGFLLMVSLVVSAAVHAFTTWAVGHSTLLEPALHVINAVVLLGVETMLFALMYKVLPDVKLQWRQVWVGALITGILFGIGRYLLGLYLGSGSVGSAYGAAGSLVILLLWIYYSALLFLLGAEFTHVYAMRYGPRVRPKAHAVPVMPEARAAEGLEPDKETRSWSESDRGLPLGDLLLLALLVGIRTLFRRRR